jgi:acetyl-CoA/propionyl-CoA carboxylase biotin carboxyl carrier protein
VASRTLVLRQGDREYRVVVGDDGRVTVDGTVFELQRRSDREVLVAGDGGTVAWIAGDGDARWVFANGRAFELTAGSGRGGARRRGAHHGSLTAPMPATVRRVEVTVGQEVRRGDTLLVLEAMKMELPVKATRDGTVERIECREGELVQPGIPLIEIGEN